MDFEIMPDIADKMNQLTEEQQEEIRKKIKEMIDELHVDEFKKSFNQLGKMFGNDSIFSGDIKL